MNARCIATSKGSSYLGTQKIDKQSPSDNETDAAPNDITREGIHEVSQSLGCEDGHRQSPRPKAASEPARARNRQSCAEQQKREPRQFCRKVQDAYAQAH